MWTQIKGDYIAIIKEPEKKNTTISNLWPGEYVSWGNGAERETLTITVQVPVKKKKRVKI